MTGQSLPFAEIVQPILTEERRLELSPRDIALLATIKVEIERNPDGLLSIPYSAIQGLSSRIDLLDVKDPQKAERRMSESMTRLLNAGCLTKAEILRLRLSGDAEYQLTSLGESVADWHVAQSRFSGEPLTAIFKAFINQVSRIVEDAEKAETPDEWHFDTWATRVDTVLQVRRQSHHESSSQYHGSCGCSAKKLRNDVYFV